MVYSVTYDVICSLCNKIAWHGEIGEYPWSWQFLICPRCGDSAVPDLEHPTEHCLKNGERCLLCKTPFSDGDGLFEVNGFKWFCESCKVDIANNKLSESVRLKHNLRP